MKHLRTQAEALCRTVAPDVVPEILYVVLRPELPLAYQMGDGLVGCTLRHMDLILEPALRRLGRWCGRGPTMLIDPKAIASTAEHRPRGSRRGAFPSSVMGVVLHELAHIIELGIEETEPSAELLRIGRKLLKAELSGTVVPTNGPEASIPWRWHEWNFIRTALHLAHRAGAYGVDVWPSDVFEAPDHGLSSIRHYAAALGDEPARFMGASFSLIKEVPPPGAFAELWQSDVLAWMPKDSRYRPGGPRVQPEDLSTTAAMAG